MAYESHGFLPFLFESFLRKNCCLIVVDLLLFGWLCCWLNCLLNLFLAHKKGKVIFRTITFGSLFQHLVYFTSIKYTIWKSITITTFFTSLCMCTYSYNSYYKVPVLTRF